MLIKNGIKLQFYMREKMASTGGCVELLDEIPDKKHFLAIMDDWMVHSKEKDHSIALLKTLIRMGLQISPKMCLIFR